MARRGNSIADRLISFFELSNTIPDVKRRLFITLQTVGIVLLLFATTLLPFLGINWFNTIADVVMLLFLTAMTWLLWRRRERQELLVFIVFFGSAAWLLSVMFYNLLQVPSAILTASLIRVVSPWLLWLTLIYMISFFTFRALTALRMSLFLSVLFGLILLFCLARAPGVRLTVLYDFVFLFAANFLVIVMAFPLAQAQERSALTDFLTGLANRNRGYNALVSEVERAQRYNEAFSIILFDLDHFKKVNDSFGHPIGDAVLQEIAAFIAEQTRRTDLLCRWGGEEFLLLMTHADLPSAGLKAEHLRQQLTRRPFHQTIQLTASFGATTYYPYDSANTMLERADQALYRAKRNGRNSVQVE